MSSSKYLSIYGAVNAVEKVTVLARLLSVDSIQNNHQIKTSLAHAACYLIGSLQDINLYVVERTALYLETIKASSIKVHCVTVCWVSELWTYTLLWKL